jgi:hypothetical protein
MRVVRPISFVTPFLLPLLLPAGTPAAAACTLYVLSFVRGCVGCKWALPPTILRKHIIQGVSVYACSFPTIPPVHKRIKGAFLVRFKFLSGCGVRFRKRLVPFLVVYKSMHVLLRWFLVFLTGVAPKKRDKVFCAQNVRSFHRAFAACPKSRGACRAANQ